LILLLRSDDLAFDRSEFVMLPRDWQGLERCATGKKKATKLWWPKFSWGTTAPWLTRLKIPTPGSQSTHSAGPEAE
jgi:hypothetical protein